MLLEFVRRGAQTDLVLTHDGLPSEEMATSHQGGWAGFMEQLVERLR